MAMAAERSILVYGEEGTGKTCVTDMFLTGRHFSRYSIADPAKKQLTVDEEPFLLQVMDVRSTQICNENTGAGRDNSARPLMGADRADGVVLLYDITSRASYDNIVNRGYMNVVHYRPTEDAAGNPYLAGGKRFGCVLVGNKLDLVKESPTRREVDREEASEWATIQGIKHFEIDSKQAEAVNEVMRELVRSIRKAEKRDEEDLKRQDELLLSMPKPVEGTQGMNSVETKASGPSPSKTKFLSKFFKRMLSRFK